jgi:hypothetical protein
MQKDVKKLTGVWCMALCVLAACNASTQQAKDPMTDTTVKNTSTPAPQSAAAATVADDRKPIDTAQYNHLMTYLANGDSSGRWPVKGQPYPVPGAILPFHRIVSYYGNLYSKKMGVLGEYPKETMFKMLQHEVKRWSDADSVIKAIPALHYIAITAQGAPGKDGKYRYRMPFNQIDTILNWAKEIDALVFIDVQVGYSTLPEELPLLEKYLSLPIVNLVIDP